MKRKTIAEIEDSKNTWKAVALVFIFGFFVLFLIIVFSSRCEDLESQLQSYKEPEEPEKIFKEVCKNVTDVSSDIIIECFGGDGITWFYHSNGSGGYRITNISENAKALAYSKLDNNNSIKPVFSAVIGWQFCAIENKYNVREVCSQEEVQR